MSVPSIGEELDCSLVPCLLVRVKYYSAAQYYLFPFPNPYLPKHCAFVINVSRIIWRACGTCC